MLRSQRVSHLVLGVTAFLLGAFVAYAVISLRQPQSYEDCILKSVKEGMSREAAVFIMQACDEKYARLADLEAEETPAEEAADSSIQEWLEASRPVIRRLSAEEMERLKVQGGYRAYADQFEALVYNGSDSLHLTALTFSLQSVKTGRMTHQVSVSRYNPIGPLETRELWFRTLSPRPGSYTYEIIEAMGYSAPR